MMNLTLLLLTWVVSPSLWAGSIHETYFQKGTPSATQVQQWSSLPGTRGLLVQLEDPYADDLRLIGSIRGLDRLRVETSRFPGGDTLEEWKSLARKGAEFVSFDAGYPTSAEIELLNQIGFSNHLFVVRGYPGVSDAERLKALKSPFSLSFAKNAFPRFDDRKGLAAMPEATPFLFITDYFPWYHHVDVMNLLPQKDKRIRVRGMFPTDDHIYYLENIRDLQELIIETDFDPSAPFEWSKLGNLPIQWINLDRVPSLEALAAFEAHPSSRKLVIDGDTGLSAEERARLERSRLEVEWIHAAP